MKQSQKYSLLTYLGIIISLSAVFIVSVFLSYYYFDIKSKAVSTMKKNAKITIERLENSVLPYIESYSVNEYEKLVLQEMRNRDIMAIVLEDFHMAKVLGKNSFVTKQLKTPNENIEKYFFKEEQTIESQDKNPLAKITIYYTDKYIKMEVIELIEKSIFITLLISVILMALLFVTIKKYIINPMNKIMDQVANCDEIGIPKEIKNISGPKEIEQLSSYLNNMIITIDKSKKNIVELNRRFELTLDGVDDGIWDWDIQTDQAFFSKKWKGMLGYAKDELENSGHAFFELVHDDDKEKLENALQKHFKSPQSNPFSIELRLRCKDDSYKWVLSRGSAILNTSGEPTRMLGFHTDITLQKQKEKYKQEEDQILFEQAKLISMGEMIGNIAHQWRQPLSVITTSASGLKMKLQFFDEVKKDEIIEFSDLIVQQSDYLSKTIDNFSNFIKGDNEYSHISIKQVMEDALVLSSATLKNNYINLITKLDDDMDIYGSKTELIEAILNIINNSKDALIENQNDFDRYLFISTKKINSDTIEITIKDNGGGIDKNIIHRVFEPYFTTKHQSVGTGLGLSGVDQIIRHRHQGVVSVANSTYSYEGKEYTGSCFTIVLKAKDNPIEPL